MERTHVVKSGKVNLKKIKTDETDGLTKEEVEASIDKLQTELYELQELLFAAHSHSLLIVLQGIDTSGKEGTIGCISRGTNVDGV